MNTLPEWWTVPYPEVSSPETATAYLDALGGSINRVQDNGSWVLSTGQQELIRSESQTELDSFVLGFALAHLICERHGPIRRQQQAPAEGGPGGEGQPVVTAEGSVPAATAALPSEPAPAKPADAASDEAGDEASDEADEDDDDDTSGAGPERASLSVVPDAAEDDEDESEHSDESDGVAAAKDSAADSAAADEDEAGESVGEGSGGARRRRRRR